MTDVITGTFTPTQREAIDWVRQYAPRRQKISIRDLATLIKEKTNSTKSIYTIERQIQWLAKEVRSNGLGDKIHLTAYKEGNKYILEAGLDSPSCNQDKISNILHTNTEIGIEYIKSNLVDVLYHEYPMKSKNYLGRWVDQILLKTKLFVVEKNGNVVTSIMRSASNVQTVPQDNAEEASSTPSQSLTEDRIREIIREELSIIFKG